MVFKPHAGNAWLLPVRFSTSRCIGGAAPRGAGVAAIAAPPPPLPVAAAGDGAAMRGADLDHVFLPHGGKRGGAPGFRRARSRSSSTRADSTEQRLARN